jgi:hypothetical protein
MSTDNPGKTTDRPTTATGNGSPTIRWDASSMKSTYANAVQVTGTREEIVLLFGMHQAWHNDMKEVPVQVLERVLVNPYAAKRLSLLLNQVIRQYESRYGALEVELSTASAPPEKLPVR